MAERIEDYWGYEWGKDVYVNAYAEPTESFPFVIKSGLLQDGLLPLTFLQEAR